MRLLHVVATGSRRGAEIFASDLIGALNGGHVEQRVAVLRSPNGVSVRYEAPITVLGDGSRAVPGLGVDAAAVRRLRGVIRSWRPDVVQAHGGETLKNCVVATAGLDVPVVYRRIGGAPSSMSNVLRRSVHAALMRRAARIVTVAEAVRNETLRMFRIPPDRVITIPNAIDLGRMRVTESRRDVRRGLGLSDTTRVTMTLGALVWEKDPLAHFEVASRVLHDVPTAVHLFVGDGPLRPRLEGVIRDRDLQGRVMILGNRSDVAELLSATDVLIFASRGDGMEGMPASAIEAGIAGVPVVGYSVAGLPEIVIDGETGILVRPRDVDGLAASVVELLEDEGMRKALAVAARDRCRREFTIENVASRYLHVYESTRGEPARERRGSAAYEHPKERA
jgi:glycosyltransferase involved in cell wall biosynthesis